MNRILNFFIVLLFLSGCSTLDINVDYDESYKFTKVKTFAVQSYNKTSDNTLFNDRVVNALNNDLELKNYKKVAIDKADLIFVFHSNVKNQTQVHTDYQTMGYGMYRYAGNTVIATTSTYNYDEGTLIVDALNPKTKKIVWRAIAKKELTQHSTPQEKTKCVNKVIQNIMKKFPIK